MKPLVCAVLLLATPAVAQETVVKLNIRFDTATTTFLQEKGELVVVSGWFYGEPALGNVLPVDETGMIYLGGEEVTVWPLDQTVTLGQNLGAAPVGTVVEPKVNVNVYSARISSDDNLLDCTFVEGPTDALSKSPQKITCTLLK